MRQVIKRDKELENFDSVKIKNAIGKANNAVKEEERISKEVIDEIVESIIFDIGDDEKIDIEKIQDAVEKELSTVSYPIAKAYILKREERARSRENTIDKTINEIVGGKSKYWTDENSNKNATLLTTQRDNMAGAVSTDAVLRYLLDKDIIKAHEQGILHFHDADYFLQKMNNCGLINLEDCLQNGTVISGSKIDKPHEFSTACNVATQIIAQVASFQYGGQSFSLAHLSPFVEETRKSLKSHFPDFTEEQIERLVNRDIEKGVQTLQYQIVTLMTTNGQAPFCTLYINLAEVPEGKEREDLAKVAEEVLKQRIKGIKNEQGIYITVAFPKIIYALDEFNEPANKDSKYWYLTELAAKCTAKRMVPDYVSNKIQRKMKNGDVFPFMGAVAGEEIVSIKIEDTEYNNISVKEAIELLQEDCKKINRKTAKDVELKNICGVYKIEYKPTGNYYIGSSKNVQQRFREHRYSIAHTGAIEGNIIGDRDTNNYKFELIEECSIDELFDKEMEHINLNDELIINTIKAPRNPGNKNGGNLHFKNKYRERQIPYTKFYNCKEHCFIKSKGQWEPIEMFEINDEDIPLEIYDISFMFGCEKKTIRITEDHPLHTHRGRIQCCDLKLGDILYASETYVECPIIKIEKVNEKIKTYDFTTSNDMFDLSGIISHNCRSGLTVDRTTENYANALNYEKYKNHKYYGRFNQGVVTINLIDVAMSSKKNEEEFWKIFDERLELCHKALRRRHERLLGTKSDVAPILWQNGVYARLNKGETIDKLLFNGYSTISLGYAGLYECIKYMTGESHTSVAGKPLAIKVMKFMNDKCEQWKSEENIDYSLYGTPLESTTYKFAKCLKKRFGKEWKELSGKDYITNSYHVNVQEKIDAFTKLSFESEFQELSPGGAISYVEVPNMEDNIPAVLQIMEHIYQNILYAELNCKSDFCQKCQYTGEIKVKGKPGEMYWECPNCGNKDKAMLNIARRTCGYIGSNFWNQGRTQEIAERVLHVDQ